MLGWDETWWGSVDESMAAGAEWTWGHVNPQTAPDEN